MSIKLDFRTTDLKEAEKDYSRLQISSKQRQVIDQLADLLCQYTSMPKLPMKGFLWKAMKKWQEIHEQPCTVVLSLPYSDRLEKVQEMLTILEEQFLRKVLKSSSDNDKLSKAIKTAFEYYKEISQDM